MGAVEKIKSLFWENALKKHAPTRDRKNVKLEDAQSVLVLYDASEEYNLKEVEPLFDYLKERDIKTYSIGLAKYKIVPHYCIPQLSKKFICLKDITWFDKPNIEKTEEFIREDFDLLISLDTEANKALQFLAATSKAKFKVGFFRDENIPWFDFMIRTKNSDTKEYINQIIHYLSVFNT